MPTATRKTRSGRPAPAPPSKRIRTKGGCLTCRIRRKKCDESRDHNEGCETCARLRIQCLGYSNKRPEWLKGQQVDAIKRKIKHFLADHSAKSSCRSSDDVFLTLHTSEARPVLPVQLNDSEHSDTDSDLDSKPEMFSVHDYSSPVESHFDLESMPWTSDWSPLGSLPQQQQWGPSPLDFYPGSYVPIGHDDTETYLYGLPELVDPLHMDMSLDMLTFDAITFGPYDNYNPQSDLLPIYTLFFYLLRVDPTSESLQCALVGAFQNDPAGVSTLIDASQQDGIPERGRMAFQSLANAEYRSDRPECRALVCLCMMLDSLARGDGGLWGDCLDLILGWAKGIYSQSQTTPLSDHDVTQFVSKRAIWSDIIAGATTKRQPLLIDNYRKLLVSDEEVLDGCSNETALAMAEVVALAAHSDQIHRAGKNLDGHREKLGLDEPPSKAAVHKAGARLYLEITAHQGDVGNPAIEEAAHAVRTLASQMEEDQLRDFSFWVFLAGCNTTDEECRGNCYTMLSAGSGDKTVDAAMDIMKDVWSARGQPNFQADMWRARMNERGLLLL